MKKQLKNNILLFQELSKNIRKEFEKDEVKLSFKDYVYGAANIYIPQLYGPRIANRIAKEFKLKRSKDKNLGDFISVNNKNIEVKTTVIRNENDCANFVQIRPWQNVNYILNVNIMYEASEPIFYILNSKQMKKEISRRGQFAHGNSESNVNNKNIEYAIRYKIKDLLHLEKYRVNKEELFKKLTN